jgi:predicted component of viral defense system (DUF524 family)
MINIDVREAKLRLRVTQLKLSTSYNRFVNERITEQLSRLAQKAADKLKTIDENQDRAVEIYNEEVARIQEEQDARRAALETALANIGSETRKRMQRVDALTTL